MRLSALLECIIAKPEFANNSILCIMYSRTEYLAKWVMAIPIIRIKYFLAVVICGTFSEAAEMMYTTQATVSKNIAALEKEVGIALFDRTRRKAGLTEAGKVFLTYAERLLDDYNEMIQALGKLSATESVSTSLAAIPVMAHYGIISLIGQFRKHNPHVNFIVDERESANILLSLEEEQYEMAFTREEGIDHKVFQCLRYCSDRLAAVLPSTHPLAGKASLSLRELADEDFILLGKQVALHQFCVSACRKTGFQPNIVYTGTRVENIMEIVSQGNGVSLLMEKTAKFVQSANTKIVRLEEDLLSHLVLVRLRRHTPSGAGNLFWQFIRQQSQIER